MPLPDLSPEQRAAALEKAAAARKARAELRERLKSKGATVGDVLKQGDTDEVIGKMRVSAVLESLPGVGKARAAKIMERLEISPTRRVRGLGANQRRALEAEFEDEKVVLTRFGRTRRRPRTRTTSGRLHTPARLTVLSGPSGVGKGTVVAEVRRRHPDVWVSVSVTTRRPRPGEVDGVHYHFVDDAEFDRLIATDGLLEWAEYAGNRYGTPAAPGARAAGGRRARRCWRSSCRAPARSGPATPRRSWSSSRPPSWAALVSRLAGRGLRAAGRAGAPAGPRAGRAGRLGGVRRGGRQRRRRPRRR